MDARHLHFLLFMAVETTAGSRFMGPKDYSYKEKVYAFELCLFSSEEALEKKKMSRHID